MLRFYLYGGPLRTHPWTHFTISAYQRSCFAWYCRRSCYAHRNRRTCANQNSSDEAHASQLLVDIDDCFFVFLFVADATGLLLLALRGTGAMRIMLALHFGVIVALFVTLPYCKFVHALYRGAAPVRSAAERPRRAASAVKATAVARVLTPAKMVISEF